MSHLQYQTYPPAGLRQPQSFLHSYAVRVDDRIECAGQGGWDPESGLFEKEVNGEVDVAFKNIEHCLKDAGGKGWSQVYRVNSYHVPLNNEAIRAMARNFRIYMPDHKPLWTCIGVSRLGDDDMRVKIEVVAHDPRDAAAKSS